jgi:hypothetical protein
MCYVFDEDDLVQLLSVIIENQNLDKDILLSLAKINSSGVIDIKNKTKCPECDKYVDDTYDHLDRYSKKYRDDCEWNCKSIEVPICKKCDKYVNNSKEHCVAEGDLTYSSVWECI